MEDEWFVLRVVMSGTFLCEAIMAHRLANKRGHDGHYEWTGPLKLEDMAIEWRGPLKLNLVGDLHGFDAPAASPEPGLDSRGALTLGTF